MTEHPGNPMFLLTTMSCLCGLAALTARIVETYMLHKAPPVHLVVRWCLLVCAGIAFTAMWSALHGSADPWLMISGIVASLVSAGSLFFR